MPMTDDEGRAEEHPADDQHQTETRQLPPVRIRTRRSPQPAPEAEGEPSAGAAAPLPAPAPAEPSAPRIAPAPKRKGDYEVGYGKPPKHTQFKPNNRANPKGRPRGSRSLSTLVDEALSRPIKVKIGGKTKTITQREAMVHQYIDKAMRGDLKAFAVLLRLDPKARQEEAEAEARGRSADLSADEVALLMAFLKRDEGDDQ